MKKRFTVCVLFTLALTLGSSLIAAAPEKIFGRNRVIPENGTVAEDVVWVDGREISFQPPLGWRESFATNEVQANWLSEDRSSSMMLTFKPNVSTDKKKFQEIIGERFPGARLIEEAPCYAANEKGTMVDLEYVNSHRVRKTVRFARVAYAGGAFEFELAAPAESFPKWTLPFATLLNSLRVNAVPVR